MGNSEQEAFLVKVVQKVESDYLIIENRKRCQIIFLKDNIDSHDIIDAFIALHIILEVGLNGLFRQLSLRSIKKGVDELEVTQNLDKISFIDKTVLFIYNSNFNFSGSISDATTFHKVIGKLKNFSQIRNALLHGHTISSVNVAGQLRDSVLKGKLTHENLTRQVEDFKFIMKGLGFYVDHLSPELSQGDKDLYKNRYLDYSFIPDGQTPNKDINTKASTVSTIQTSISGTARIVQSSSEDMK